MNGLNDRGERIILEMVEELDAMSPGDPESDHSRADDLLLDALRLVGRSQIADAWEAARERCGWWYA